MVDFGNAGKWTREILAQNLFEGAKVIDATMGNGHDTLFLSNLVGESGHVWAFDVQESALENTKQRLLSENALDNVTLILADHALMRSYVNDSVDAVLFNLGWLPGKQHIVTTKVESTLSAIGEGLELLKSGGFMTICVYPGHEEGQKELSAIEAFARSLDDKKFDVISRGYENISLRPPRLFAIAKKQ